jgi:hypothetical protein
MGEIMKRLVVWIFIMIAMTGMTACRKQEADNTMGKDAVVTTVPTQAPANESEVSPPVAEDEAATNDYKVSDVKLDMGDKITGVYPQINGLTDGDKQHTINQMIEEATMEFIEYFKEDDVTIELSYDVPWKGERMLSLRYYMYYYADGAAHPNNNYTTLNFDLVNGKRIRLSDIVTIDDDFAKTMREYSVYSGPLENSTELEEFMSANLSVQDSAAFSNADYSTDYFSMYTYFTENTIGFNLVVPHAIGDYALYEVNLANIKDYFKVDSPVWKDFKEALEGKPSQRREAVPSKEEPDEVSVDETNTDDLNENLCAANEEILFGFPVKDSKKRLTVCVEKNNQEYIVYRFGTKDKLELVYPDSVTDSWSGFVYSYYFRGGGTDNEGQDLNYLTFDNNGFRYRIFQEYTAASEETEVGILVTDLASGKETRITGVSEEAEGDLINLRDSDKITIENE